MSTDRERPETSSRGIVRIVARIVAACAAAVGMAIVMTWPLATGFGRLGRPNTADGMYAIWNVSWVARTLVEEPTRLFHANIFHPERWTLAFSELNLVAGIVGIPGWLLTGNAYVAHNTALLFAFSSSALCAWLLARRLSGSSAAALVAGVMFGFCPYFFAHTAHIQLLMGGGIPLSLLMLHRIADAPSPGRGVALGVALGTQALACAYYGILAGLMIGYASMFFGVSRSLWRDRAYWLAVVIGAGISVLIVAPFFMPFLEVQAGGFGRTLDESRTYSANLPSYMASPARAHQWLLRLSARVGQWNEVLFPGGLALVLGLGGLAWIAAAPRAGEAGHTVRDRETVLLYASLGLLTLWASLGPAAGLYSALFHAVPLFSFLRAPSRFGVVIPLVLGVFASLALARLPARRRTAVSIVVAALVAVELNSVPFAWDRAPAVPSPYAYLAQLPRAPVAEFPFYNRPVFYLHAQYMLFSTRHWQPLVNGYSDHIPQPFRDDAVVLETFPSHDSFGVLRRRRVRYITVHWHMFGPREEEIRDRLRPFQQHLRQLASDEMMTLYEIVSFP